MDEQSVTPPASAGQHTPVARPRARRTDRTFTPPVIQPGGEPALTLAGGSLRPAECLGRLLGLESLHILHAQPALDSPWPDQIAAMRLGRQPARTGLSDVVLAAPALTVGDVGALVAVRRAGQSQQASFLDDIERTPLAITVVVGLIGQRDGALSDDAGVLAWQVTERQVRAAQRLLADEAGVLASPVGSAGFAALVRALLADRQLPVRARRFPRELSVVVVSSDDAGDTGGLLLASGSEPGGLNGQPWRGATMTEPDGAMPEPDGRGS